ncbi:hypothetical protein LINGRAHAP2_LOCUS10692 [Linum grandiflorum]
MTTVKVAGGSQGPRRRRMMTSSDDRRRKAEDDNSPRWIAMELNGHADAAVNPNPQVLPHSLTFQIHDGSQKNLAVNFLPNGGVGKKELCSVFPMSLHRILVRNWQQCFMTVS